MATRSAPGEAESGGVSYASVDRAYFEKCGLSRYTGIWSLWALGVGAVISGHFSGWNLGFATGGWGGMLVAGIVFAVMYLGLVFCLAEMSPALPHTGAAYSFARTAMGPWGGFITGLRENVEYVIMPAVIVRFTTACVNTIFGLNAAYSPVIWVLFYAVFLCLNAYGLELSFKVTLVAALLSLAILAFFWINAIPNMDFQRWALNTVPGGAELPGGNGPLFPFGFSGVLATLPLAVWLFLAIEQLPLVAEESVSPARDMPKGILLGMLTLIVSAFLIVLLNPSVTVVGAHKLGTSLEPLLDGFRDIYGDAGIAVLVGHLV
jgi:ethanolamine permease